MLYVFTYYSKIEVTQNRYTTCQMSMSRVPDYLHYIFFQSKSKNKVKDVTLYSSLKKNTRNCTTDSHLIHHRQSTPNFARKNNNCKSFGNTRDRNIITMEIASFQIAIVNLLGPFIRARESLSRRSDIRMRDTICWAERFADFAANAILTSSRCNKLRRTTDKAKPPSSLAAKPLCITRRHSMCPKPEMENRFVLSYRGFAAELTY